MSKSEMRNFFDGEVASVFAKDRLRRDRSVFAEMRLRRDTSVSAEAYKKGQGHKAQGAGKTL